MRDDIQLYVGESNGTPRRLVQAIYRGAEIHRDTLDTDNAWARTCFAKALLARLSSSMCAEELAEWASGTSEQEAAPAIADRLMELAIQKDREAAGSGPTIFRRITSADLAKAARTPPNWLVEDILLAGEPVIVSGAEKSLKTTNAAELAISLATTRPFFGQFAVPRAVNVGFFSGESGEVTLGETGLRIAAAKGLDFETDCQNLVWSDQLPDFANANDLDGIAEFIKADELEVLIIDPAYLCMDLEGRESSMFAVGKLLRRIATLCKSLGVTLIILHHTKSDDEARGFRPPRLQDIAWAGFKQFARQWIMLSRREPYSLPGEHKLWMVVSGSRGHGDTYGIDVSEGRYPNRYWQAALLTREEAEEAVDAAAAKSKTAKSSRQIEADIEADMSDIVRVIVARKSANFKAEFKKRTKISGTRFERAWARLLDEEQIYQWPEQRAENHRLFATFYSEPAPEKTSDDSESQEASK